MNDQHLKTTFCSPNVLGVDFLSLFVSLCFFFFLSFILSFLLTHPDFSKLSRSKFLHHLNRIFGNLPGVFVPWLLSFGFYTRAVQFSTQAICFVWEVHHKDAENYFIPALMFKTHIIPLKCKVNYFHLRTSWGEVWSSNSIGVHRGPSAYFNPWPTVPSVATLRSIAKDHWWAKFGPVCFIWHAIYLNGILR